MPDREGRPAVSCDDVLHLRVELRVRDGTIDGALIEGEGEGRPVTFTGWIGLVAAIDQAVRRGERAPGAPAERRLPGPREGSP